MHRDIHRRLRDATRSDHERLEGRLDLRRRVGTLDGRRALVAGFCRLHAEIEAAVAPWLADLAGLDFGCRLRTPMLRRDAEALGFGLPEPELGLQAQDRAEALGLLYVSEGSSLGGQVIRRQLASDGADFRGLSFLDPYGADTGLRWRGFLAVLAREAPDGPEAEACVAGALSGFRHAEARLCGEPALV